MTGNSVGMGLAAKITLGVMLVGTVAVPAISYVTFRTASAVLEEKIEKETDTLARLIMGNLDRTLHHAQADILSMGEDESIEVWLRGLRGVRSQFDDEDIARALDEKALHTGPWEILFVADRDGIHVASSDRTEIGKPMDDEPLSKIAWAAAMQGRVYHSDLVISEDVGRPTMIFAAPIRDEDLPSRPVIGAVIGNFAWPVVLQSLDKVPAGTRVRVFNKEGLVVGARTSERHLLLKENLRDRPAVAEMLGHTQVPQGEKEVQDEWISSVNLQSGYLSFRGNGWGVLIEAPRDQVMAPVRELARKVFVTTIIALIASALILHLLAKALTRPITELTRSVERVGRGDYTVRAQVRAADETGILARAFNRMTEQVGVALKAVEDGKRYFEGVVTSMNDALIVVNPAGTIESMNRAACTLLECDCGETADPGNRLTGKPIGSIFAEEEEEEEEEVFQGTRLKELVEKGSIQNVEVNFKTKSGEHIPMSLSGSAMRDEEGKLIGIVCVARDMREYRRLIAEAAAAAASKERADELEAAYREKETLMREVHHRVKNNMQIINSLLRLQARKLADPKLQVYFQDSQSRVRCMALIHEKLYRSEDISSINACDYLEELVNGLAQLYSTETGKIKFNFHAENVSFGIDQGIYCGLILNELISNAIKYAFPGDRTGRVDISIIQGKDSAYELTVRDDGVGLPDAIDPRKTESLGLQLITNLVEAQLRGKLDVTRDNGTEFKISFTIPDTAGDTRG